MLASFFRGKGSEAHDGEGIARFAQVSRGTVEFDGTAAGGAEDDVGFEAFTVGHICDEDAFVFE